MPMLWQVTLEASGPLGSDDHLVMISWAHRKDSKGALRSALVDQRTADMLTEYFGRVWEFLGGKHEGVKSTSAGKPTLGGPEPPQEPG